MNKLITKIVTGITLAGLILVSGCGSEPSPQTTNNNQNNQSTQSSTNNQGDQALPKLLSLGTNPNGTILNSLGAGIGTELTKTMGIQVKVIAMNGQTEWMPMLDSGEIDMGMINSWDAEQGWKGAGTYGPISNNKGFPLTLITSGHKSMVGIIVANNSNIKTGADLKGKKYAGTVSGTPGVTLQDDAMLANFGLKRTDVIEITVPNLVAAVQAVETGQADAAGVALGTPEISALDASNKGARFLSLDSSPEASKRMTDVFPGKVTQVSPGQANVGIRQNNTNLLSYDFYLVGRNKLNDATVYSIVKNLWDSNKDLTSINSNLSDWTTDNFLVENFTIPVHPGAIKLYKEKGIWTPAMDQRQASLLASKK